MVKNKVLIMAFLILVITSIGLAQPTCVPPTAWNKTYAFPYISTCYTEVRESLYVAGNTYLVGNIAIDGDVTASGGIDLSALYVSGANQGITIKATLASGDTFTGSTGAKFKTYFADTTVNVTGGELFGVYANVKVTNALSGGAKSMIYSGHNYGSGGIYESLDAGMWLYGDLVDALKISGGTSTTGLDLSEQTITTSDIQGHEGEIIFNDPDGTWGFGSANLVTTGNITCDTLIGYVVGTVVDWDTLGAYIDSTITNAIIDSFGAYYDTTTIKSTYAPLSNPTFTDSLILLGGMAGVDSSSIVADALAGNLLIDANTGIRIGATATGVTLGKLGAEVTVQDLLTVIGTCNVGGALTASGAVNLGSDGNEVTIGNSLTIGGTCDVDGALTIHGPCNVGGALAITEACDVGGALTIGGTCDISGELTIKSGYKFNGGVAFALDSITSGAADSVYIGWKFGKPDTITDFR